MLEPVEISFKVPFTGVVTSQLKLRNPSDRPVFFKVKGNAPGCYCVSPNSGVVKPGDTVNIMVAHQPVGQAATLESERSRREFMIQTAFGPDADTPVDTFWKTADLSQVMDWNLEVMAWNRSSVDSVWSSTVNAASPTNAATHATREHSDISANISEYSADAQTAHSPSAEHAAMKAQLDDITKQLINKREAVSQLQKALDTSRQANVRLREDKARLTEALRSYASEVKKLREGLAMQHRHLAEWTELLTTQREEFGRLHIASDTAPMENVGSEGDQSVGHHEPKVRNDVSDKRLKEEVQANKRTVDSLKSIIDAKNRAILEWKLKASENDELIEERQRTIDSLNLQLKILTEKDTELRDSANGQQGSSIGLHDVVGLANCVCGIANCACGIANTALKIMPLLK